MDSFLFQSFTGLKFEHVNTITLGDLPKAEAYRYFEHVIKTKHPEAKRESFPNEAGFDKVFSITGGRMMYIEQYVGYVARSGSQPTGDYFYCYSSRQLLKVHHLIHPLV
jgi:hypothetical protein